MAIDARELMDLFEDGSIGPAGIRISNGADYYRCPSCFASKDTQGYCDPTTDMKDISHQDDCKLNLLYNKTWQECYGLGEPT